MVPDTECFCVIRAGTAWGLGAQVAQKGSWITNVITDLEPPDPGSGCILGDAIASVKMLHQPCSIHQPLKTVQIESISITFGFEAGRKKAEPRVRPGSRQGPRR